MTNRDQWIKYHEVINEPLIKADYPELYTLFQCVRYVYTNNQSINSISINELELSLLSLYPRTTIELYRPLLNSIVSVDVNEHTLLDILKITRTRAVAGHLARKALAVSDGHEDIEELNSSIAAYHTEQETLFNESLEEENDFLNDDLQSLVNEQLSGGGLNWRLGSLNKALGPLRKGDFGFVFARPETGKTTFLASELSFMAEQLQDSGPILWFNNEEQGSKVYIRIYQASLGLTTQRLVQNIEENHAKYKELTKGSLRFIDDKTSRASSIERIIHSTKPRLIVFDQIDKIQGFSGDRSDLELSAKYIWARGLAKEYCPVIGICQAGSTGDGKKWLTMNDVDNSKTGKQAEADWILGIGKTYDFGLESVRYLHLSKNKLSGGLDSDPSLRHGRWEVLIKPEIARYEDFV